MAALAAEYEQAEIPKRRRSPRAPVSFDAELGKGGLGRTLCKVVDVSLHGCRLQTYSALRRGNLIWLNLPHAGPVAAEVVWADDYAAGCRFARALDPAMLALLIPPVGGE